MDIYLDALSHEELNSIYQSQRVSLLHRRHATMAMKMTICTLVGYKFIRYINDTKRVVNITVTDCTGVQHTLSKLLPHQDTLLIAAPADHRWSAIDMCTSKHHNVELSADPVRMELTCKVSSGILSLKDSCLMFLGDRLRYEPGKVNQLPLPLKIKRELLGNMIPVPDKPRSPCKLHCVGCGHKLPKVIDFNPITSQINTSNVDRMEELINDLNEYVSTTNLAETIIGKTFSKSFYGL